MQFQKNTSLGKSSMAKLLIKIVVLFISLFLLVFLVDKINFPYPNKNIEKNITNDNIKIIK
jgi:hypothetical protein|tara:strand:+ start:435 stop:617 length:183 start_codon:yes stop_codon:yes gene_type:complete